MRLGVWASTSRHCFSSKTFDSNARLVFVESSKCIL